MSLDKNRPYGQISGDHHAAYVQDGRYFDAAEREIDEFGSLVVKSTPVLSEVNSVDSSRKDHIAAAIALLPSSGFTAAGLPKVHEIRSLIGFDVTREEVDNVWNETSA